MFHSCWFYFFFAFYGIDRNKCTFFLTFDSFSVNSSWLSISSNVQCTVYSTRRCCFYFEFQLPSVFWFCFLFFFCFCSRCSFCAIKIAVDIYDEHFYSLLLINSWTIFMCTAHTHTHYTMHIRRTISNDLLFVWLFVTAERYIKKCAFDFKTIFISIRFNNYTLAVTNAFLCVGIVCMWVSGNSNCAQTHKHTLTAIWWCNRTNRNALSLL